MYVFIRDWWALFGNTEPFVYHSKESEREWFPCCEWDCWEPNMGKGEREGNHYAEL